MTSHHIPGVRGSRWMAALVLAGVLILTAFALVPELGDLLPRNHDETAVAAVAQRVIITNQSVGLPPARDSNGDVSPETVEIMRTQVRAVAAQLFTEDYRQQWIERTIEVIDIETSSEYIFDGGAHDFSRWRITVAGDRASVQVRCRIYLEMAQTFDGPRHRAENTVDYELTLERVDGAWLVSAQSHRFAPGGGP